MPRPRNQKKKRQNHNKKDKEKKAQPQQSPEEGAPPCEEPDTKSLSPTPAPPTPPPLAPHVVTQQQTCEVGAQTYSPEYLPPMVPYPEQLEEHLNEPHHSVPSALSKTPFIYDPGNGPRVKDAQTFLASRFAAPPSLEDAMCAEFADEAVLQMLCSVLPEETALILWYNKSRRNSRICPACQRLYRLGDVLPDHLAGEDAPQRNETRASPYLAREQELSGLCSPVCFILAAYNHPGAIRSTWGRMAEELDDATWDLLDAPTPPNAVHDLGLGMLLKMTRCHDLGLGQLFFPDLADDEDRDGSGSGADGSEETVRELEPPEGKTAVEPATTTEKSSEAVVRDQLEKLQVTDGVTASGEFPQAP